MDEKLPATPRARLRPGRAKTRTRLKLSPVMLAALKELAAKEGLDLETFITVLINEALTHRLVRR
jgi:predicted DNA binding CopG/RHH family protein